MRVDSLPSSPTLGRYQIVREIARSNDIVYEAIDPAIGRRVALKELQVPPNLVGAQRRERVERFYREAKAAGSLSHPNIVIIHEVGEDRGRHFIAMEFLEGQTLREVLQVQGPLPLPQVVQIVSEVASALDYAHDHGVIHRDVKPDNVYLLTDGRIKLTDFGIARLMFEANLTADGQVFGTPSYMSPEQVAGKPIDPRSDIFSLGVMLYEMLSGRKPFPGDSVITITYNIMHQEPLPLPGLAPAVQRVVLRALAKDPQQRYRTAGELARELRAAAASTAAHSPGRGAVGAGGVPGGTSGQASPANPGVAVGAARVSSPNSPTGLFMAALAGLRADDFWLPRRRPLLRLGPQARAWLTWLLGAVVIGCVLFFFLWSTMQAYEGYLKAQKRDAASRHLQAGLHDYNQKQYERAIAQFEAAARVDPDSEIGQTARFNGARTAARYAQIFEANGNRERAEYWYRRAIEIDPGYAMAYHFLATLAAAGGQEAVAERLWQRAIQVAESRLREPGLSAEVRAEAQQTIDQAQLAWGVLLLNRGQRLLSVRRYAEARRVFEAAIQVAPGTDVDRVAQEWLARIPALP